MKFFSTEWFSSKTGLQILSVCLAFLAWLVVNSGQTIKETKTVEIQYVQLPKGLIFQRTPPREIKVEVAGPLSRIRALNKDNLFYVLDLSTMKPGANRVEIDVDMLKLPTEIDIFNITPRSFNIHIEEFFVRSLPVKLNIVGKPKEGYHVVSSKVSPELVSVTGPKSIISKLTEVPVEVTVSNRELSYFETVKPRLNFPDVEVLDSPMVELEISSIRTVKEFISVPVVAKSTKERVSISPPMAKVILEGAEKDLELIREKLQVTVAVEGLKRGRYRLRGDLVMNSSLNSSLKLVSLDPMFFLVEIR